MHNFKKNKQNRINCSVLLVRINMQFKNVLNISGNQILAKVHPPQRLIGQTLQRAQ